MTKKSKIALGIVGLSTAGIAAGAVGGVAASQNTMVSTSQTINNEDTIKNEQTPVVDNSTNTGNQVETTTPEVSKPVVNESIQTTTNENGFSVRLTRSLTRSAEQEQKFVLNIDKNTNKEGAIFLIDNEGNMQSQMEVKPGDLIKVGVSFYAEYAETHTVRDLLIYGKSESYRLATQQVTGVDNQFTFKLPTMEEQRDKMTGENMFYGDNGSAIQIIPSFIVKSIGENTNWEHGAFNGDLNGYVFSFTKDMKWSDLVMEIVNGQFDNIDPSNPIDIYVYLNGHTLTVDEGVKLPPVAQKGWAVHFYNQSSKTQGTMEPGKIVPENKEAQMDVKGTVAFGRDVEYKYIQYGEGIRFLESSNTSWVGAISNNPKA